jgi:PAS domain-containing protein
MKKPTQSLAKLREENAALRARLEQTEEILRALRADGQREAIRNQRTLSELVERSPFGIYIVDSQFRIALMNAGSQTGAFRNVRPVIGRDLAEAMRTLWPEPVAAGIIGHFRHTLETGEPYYSPPFFNPRADVEIVEGYEWELHRTTLPDGQHGVICYYYDSTKLRTAEARLRESEERFRAIAANTPDHVLVQDRDLRYTLVVNPQLGLT